MRKTGDRLAKAINSMDGDAYAEYTQLTHLHDGEDLIFHYVNVWKHPSNRHPVVSIILDGDGYTWGHHFEHNRPAGTDVEQLASEIIQAAAHEEDR